MTNIPDWAGKRACELLNAESARDDHWRFSAHSEYAAVRALAKLVMQHEQEPVDPDVEAVKRILSMAMTGGLDADISWSDDCFSCAVAQYKKERGHDA